MNIILASKEKCDLCKRIISFTERNHIITFKTPIELEDPINLKDLEILITCGYNTQASTMKKFSNILRTEKIKPVTLALSYTDELVSLFEQIEGLTVIKQIPPYYETGILKAIDIVRRNKRA